MSFTVFTGGSGEEESEMSEFLLDALMQLPNVQDKEICSYKMPLWHIPEYMITHLQSRVEH